MQATVIACKIRGWDQSEIVEKHNKDSVRVSNIDMAWTHGPDTPSSLASAELVG